MHRLIVPAFCALVGCAATPPEGGLRAPDDPIYSNASFDLTRLAGDWRQVAGFAGDTGGCAAGWAGFRADPSGRLVGDAQVCVGGRVQAWSGLVVAAGPGRFTVGSGEAWWVLWDEADNRTLVIGTPSGAFGFVLNRDGPISGDRLVAAREILDFNGYDLARLTQY